MARSITGFHKTKKLTTRRSPEFLTIFYSLRRLEIDLKTCNALKPQNIEIPHRIVSVEGVRVDFNIPSKEMG